jgi:hypothetical protein
VFVCKSYYFECVIKELGINNNTSSNTTYKPTALDKDEILTNHRSLMTSPHIQLFIFHKLTNIYALKMKASWEAYLTTKEIIIISLLYCFSETMIFFCSSHYSERSSSMTHHRFVVKEPRRCHYQKRLTVPEFLTLHPV